MKRLAAILLILFTTNIIHAQQPAITVKHAFECANNFYGYLFKTNNPDSALYCLHVLASNEKYRKLLQSQFDDVYSLSFGYRLAETDTARINNYRQQLKIVGDFLEKIETDTNKVVKDIAQPLYQFLQVQQNINNPKTVEYITNDFIKTQINPNISQTANGRYAIAIYKQLTTRKRYQPLANKLVTTLLAQLKNHLVAVTDSTTRNGLEERARCRMLYAYTNFLLAGKAQNIKQKGIYLKEAYTYSPDIHDRGYPAAYFYDMLFLTGDEVEGFTNEYLQYLEETGSTKKQILTILQKIALTDPVYKNKLQEYYSQNFKLSQPFSDYWLSLVNKSGKPAPKIMLQAIAGNNFSTDSLKGKWVLVDFWGTWCIPCRQEHPGLEKFYTSTVLKNNAKIALFTIACNDTLDKVVAYMHEKKFSFPVAMDDASATKNYKVMGYPTKILITPQGNYVQIPFTENWAAFVAQYCNL